MTEVVPAKEWRRSGNSDGVCPTCSGVWSRSRAKITSDTEPQGFGKTVAGGSHVARSTPVEDKTQAYCLKKQPLLSACDFVKFVSSPSSCSKWKQDMFVFNTCVDEPF